jgi:hypothetical protein
MRGCRVNLRGELSMQAEAVCHNHDGCCKWGLNIYTYGPEKARNGME